MIGFLILLTGTGIAIQRSSEAGQEGKQLAIQNKLTLEDNKRKGINVREVLCEGLTEEDLELYKFVKDHPAGSGGFSDLITPALLQKSLETRAAKRVKLGYAPHPPACTSEITPDPSKPQTKVKTPTFKLPPNRFVKELK